jgi:hypothetical protein
VAGGGFRLGGKGGEVEEEGSPSISESVSTSSEKGL